MDSIVKGEGGQKKEQRRQRDLPVLVDLNVLIMTKNYMEHQEHQVEALIV